MFVVKRFETFFEIETSGSSNNQKSYNLALASFEDWLGHFSFNHCALEGTPSLSMAKSM
jgi:hypothetical protein